MTLDEATARALRETRSAWLQFIRNGRWGTCVACPRDSEHNAYPEFCEYTDRYDHRIDLDPLVEKYKRQLGGR